MRWGLDITADSIIVVTEEGTAGYANAVRPLVENESIDDGGLEFLVDGEAYLVVGSSASVDDDDEPTPLIVGGGETEWEALVTPALETVLDRTTASGAEDGEGGVIGSIDRSADTSRHLSEIATDLDIAYVDIDPGVAMCYASFDHPPTGVGIAIGDGVASAALCLGGVPVSTANIPYAGQWYDVTETACEGDEGVEAEWTRVKYESLQEDLLWALASTAPTIIPPLPVAVGGADAPDLGIAIDVDPAGNEFPFDIESVTRVDDSAAAPSRGAYSALDATDEREGPVPVYAATDAYVSGLVDLEAAMEAIEGGIDGIAEGTAESAGVGSSARHAQRHYDRILAAISRLLDTVESDGDTGEIDGLRSEIDEKLVSLGEDIDALDGRVESVVAVADLEADIEEIDASVADLDADVRDIRGVLTGLEEGESVEIDGLADALESMTIGTLYDDLDDVESALSNRIEQLWQEIDGVNDELVDLDAQVDELPPMQARMTDATTAIEEHATDIEALRRALDEVKGSVEAASDASVTDAELQSVSDTIDGVGDRVEAVESALANADWATPESIDGVEHDLDALRDTVVDHARRLEAIERTISDVDDRLDKAFQGTAKAEALASVQTEVSRMQQDVSTALERSGELTDTADGLDRRVTTIKEDVDQVESMVDGLAERSAIRSEMLDEHAIIDDQLVELETTQEALSDRIDELPRDSGPAEPQFPPRTVKLLAGGLAGAGVFGSLLSVSQGQMIVALAFAIFVLGPAGWLWLSIYDQ